MLSCELAWAFLLCGEGSCSLKGTHAAPLYSLISVHWFRHALPINVINDISKLWGEILAEVWGCVSSCWSDLQTVLQALLLQQLGLMSASTASREKKQKEQ
uniref:Secreted protein n=1 Tax=Nothobranchius furzeri TaxID=105023 RepID=A0A8C6K6W2_NOTFU